MSNSLSDRIEIRLKALNMKAAAASKKATGDPDTIRNIQRGRSANPRADTMRKLADVLQTSEAWLLTGKDPSTDPVGTAQPGEAVPAPMAPHPPAPHSPSRYIPVFGLAAGSVTGALTMTNDPIEDVLAPKVLERVRDAYALIVTGSSMWPRYEAGDYVFVHPHKPIRQGDHVVIQEARDGGTAVSIKRFERQTDTHIVTTQYNPLATVEFSRKAIMAMHRVLTPNEVAGI